MNAKQSTRQRIVTNTRAARVSRILIVATQTAAGIVLPRIGLMRPHGELFPRCAILSAIPIGHDSEIPLSSAPSRHRTLRTECAWQRTVSPIAHPREAHKL